MESRLYGPRLHQSFPAYRRCTCTLRVGFSMIHSAPASQPNKGAYAGQFET